MGTVSKIRATFRFPSERALNRIIIQKKSEIVNEIVACYNYFVNKSFVIKILAFFVIVWFVFSAGKTLYENWRVNKEVKALKDEIVELRKESEEMKDKILYYQSPSYREKIARERFGLQKPGEEVVVIVPEKTSTKTDKVEKDKNQSNTQKWWDYFFGVDD
jgi:cell division protein FtsB